MSSAIFWIRDIEPLRLAVMPKPHGGSELKSEVENWRKEGIAVVVSLLCPDELEELSLSQEGEACSSAGIQYRSFPIMDRGVPDSTSSFFAMTDDLTALLKQDVAVAVHCRAGIGRSALTAGVILLGLGIPSQEVFPMLSRARGFTIPDTPSQIAWFNSVVNQYGVRSNNSCMDSRCKSSI